MEYTFTGSQGHTFEVITVNRHLTPIESLLVIECLVFDELNKEVAKIKLNQIPMVSDFYEAFTQQYPECRLDKRTYSLDVEELGTWLGERYRATRPADYDLRVL